MSGGISVDDMQLLSIEDKRLSLRKSAFSPAIYQGIPLDFFVPLINNTYTYYFAKLKKVPDKLPIPKFYQSHDSLLAHYRPYEAVTKSLRGEKSQSAWYRLMEKYIRSPNYMEINSITAGSPELSALAAAEFLVNVYRYIIGAIQKSTNLSQKDMAKLAEALPELMEKSSEQEVAEALKQKKCCEKHSKEISTIILSKGSISNAVKESSTLVKRMVEEVHENVSEAHSIIRDLSGSESYNHEALSITSFLQNPDLFRERVKLLKYTYVFTKRFSQLLPTSLSHQQIVSEVGTVAGVERMTREAQIKDILPTELAPLANEQLRVLRTEFMARLMQKQVAVLRREATFKPVVFIDKSGSMAGGFENDIPKISVAAGLALALYSRFKGDVYLFDTEVTGPIDKKNLVDTLLRIEADGGTLIEEVLRTIAEIGKSDYVYIVITDAIDEVSEESIRAVSQLRNNIRFILVPPAWQREWLRRNFRYVMARDVLSFEAAALASLS